MFFSIINIYLFYINIKYKKKMSAYYNVPVLVKYEDGEKTKTRKDIYLVNAETISDAEYKVKLSFKDNTMDDMEVLGATKTKVIEVIE